MPARIRFRDLFLLGPCLALLQGCAAVMGSNSADVVAVSQPPRAEMVRDGRSGFHFGLGLGAGEADVTCEGCVFDSETGYSGFLSLARSVGTKTLLGVEASGWTEKRSGTSLRVYSLMAHLTEYLNRSSGLFLRAGLGLIGYGEDADARELSAKGFGFLGRLGYELGTGGVVFVPYVGYVRGLGGADVNVDGFDVDVNSDVIISNLQFGLSIAAH